MSAAPAKFNFDLDLARPNERGSVAVQAVSEAVVAEKVAAARSAGHAEGLVAGEQTAAAKSARQLAAAANAIGERVGAMAAAMDDNRRQMLGEAVGVAASIGRKLAGALLAREPAAEIEALIVDCLASLNGVPHLVIRCHPDLADAVREIATTRMQTSGFTGRLVVMGEPEQQLSDCRLEWVDGGLVRDSAALSKEIDEKIAAYLAARGVQGDGDVH